MTVGVDISDGTTTLLQSILPRDVVDAIVVAVAVVADVIVMGRIVLGRQVNVYFSTIGCINANLSKLYQYQIAWDRNNLIL